MARALKKKWAPRRGSVCLFSRHKNVGGAHTLIIIGSAPDELAIRYLVISLIEGDICTFLKGDVELIFLA